MTIAVAYYLQNMFTRPQVQFGSDCFTFLLDHPGVCVIVSGADFKEFVLMMFLDTQRMSNISSNLIYCGCTLRKKLA